MTLNLHRKLPAMPEPVLRYTVRGNLNQYRVWDGKWQMYLTTADVSLNPIEAEELCKILNNRKELSSGHNAGFLDGECVVCMKAERDRLLESIHKIHLMTYPPAMAEACVALECAKKANALSTERS